jgi:predicted ArsR family transcriptional regulator
MKRKPPPPPPDPDDGQADLFDLPVDLPSQPFDTSEDAADSMRGRAQTLREQALLSIWRHGGLTQDEYEVMTGLRIHTINPRFWELELRHLIVKTELRRPTRSGRNAIVYDTTERGAHIAAQLEKKYAVNEG